MRKRNFWRKLRRSHRKNQKRRSQSRNKLSRSRRRTARLPRTASLHQRLLLLLGVVPRGFLLLRLLLLRLLLLRVLKMANLLRLPRSLSPQSPLLQQSQQKPAKERARARAKSESHPSVRYLTQFNQYIIIRHLSSFEVSSSIR